MWEDVSARLSPTAVQGFRSEYERKSQSPQPTNCKLESLAEDNSIGNLRPKDQFRRLIGLCRRLEPRDVAYQAPTYNPPAGPFSQLDSILPSLTVTSHSESPAQLRSHIETAKRRSSLSSRGTVFPPSSSVAVNIGIKSPTLRTSESKTPPICLLFLL